MDLPIHCDPGVQPDRLRLARWGTEVITLFMVGKIKRMHLRDKQSVREIARRTGLSRNTVRTWLRASAERQPRWLRLRPIGAAGGALAFLVVHPVELETKRFPVDPCLQSYPRIAHLGQLGCAFPDIKKFRLQVPFHGLRPRFVITWRSTAQNGSELPTSSMILMNF